MLRKFLIAIALVWTTGAALAGKKCEEPLKSTSYERFVVLLEKIEKDGSAGQSLEQKILSYLANDTRGSVFRIEGLLRLFAEHPSSGDEFKKGYKKSRAFEDLLGHYADSLKFQRRAAALNLIDLAGVISERVVKDRAALADFLANEWGPGHEKHWEKKYKERFGEITGPEERNFLFKELADFIEDVRTRPYDLSKLQDGIHEYRRKLRWILLMAQASGGLFKLAPNADDEKRYKKYFEDNSIREASFSKIPDLFPDKNPCYISQPLFEMLTLAVFKIGEAKDSGELEENLAIAYESVGFPMSRARAQASKIAKAQKDYVEPRPMTEKWKKIIEGERILQKMRVQILSCVETRSKK